MTKASKIPDAEKLAFLRDHLAYERQMLGYAYAQMHAMGAGLAWNVHYESFAVHARNLYDFLRNDTRSGNYNAYHFVPDWKPPTYDLLFNGLDPFVFHLGMKRSGLVKLNLAGLGLLGTWLDGHWADWVNRLPEPFAGAISPAPACPVIVPTGGATPATACSAVFAATLHIPS